MRVPAVFAAVLLASCAPARLVAQDLSPVLPNPGMHQTAEWTEIASHLPDLQSAPAARLETAGDVLRARRYMADSIVYYNAAMAHGGASEPLLKKIGVACLEMQQPGLARLMFQRAVRMDKKDGVAWNDLGAAEFTLGDTRGAIGDYKRAIRYEKSSAAFHSNLALAYFEVSDARDARKELSRALQLDPDLLHRGSQGGYSAQVLASTRYPEVCFEMARIYAAQGNVDLMLEWLTKASERGYNVRGAMDNDSVLRPLLADARVKVILRNQTLRAGTRVPASAVQSLGSAEASAPATVSPGR